MSKLKLWKEKKRQASKNSASYFIQAKQTIGLFVELKCPPALVVSNDENISNLDLKTRDMHCK